MSAVGAPPSWQNAWRAAFVASWWLVYPAFAFLEAGLIYERACGDPLQPLARLMTTPAIAWPLAAVYVSAHGWLIVALVDLASPAGVADASQSSFRRRRPFPIGVVLMAIAVALEHLPAAAWRFASAQLVGCVPAS